MKWINITNKKGDSGTTQLGHQRISKSNKVFKLLGEIDHLNAFISFCSCTSQTISKSKLQEMNRQIMGGFHTGGFSSSEKILQRLDESLESVCQYLDSNNVPLDGWIDYENAWGVACTQARKVELLFVKDFASVDAYGSSCAVYNRMSKLFFVYHALERHHVVILLDRMAEEHKNGWQE